MSLQISGSMPLFGENNSKQATEHSICECAGARLLDCSSNGTFINSAQASRSCRGSFMQDGDRLSLVLSITPLVEHFFTYHAGPY